MKLVRYKKLFGVWGKLYADLYWHGIGIEAGYYRLWICHSLAVPNAGAIGRVYAADLARVGDIDSAERVGGNVVVRTRSGNVVVLPRVGDTEFGGAPEPVGEERSGKGMLEAFQLLQPYMSNEETRYYLRGVIFLGGKAMATDGYRGRILRLQDPVKDLFVPREVVDAVVSIGKPVLTAFVADGEEVTLLLENGDMISYRFCQELKLYPDLEGVLAREKENPAQLVVRMRNWQLERALRSLRKLRRAWVRFKFRGQTLTLIASDDGDIPMIREMQLPEEASDYEITLSLDLIWPVVKQLPDETVWEFRGSNKPVFIGEDIAVMPMRG